MSRASKYLRKKLAEGGQIPDLGAKLGKLKNPSKLDPNIPQNTGIAGGVLAQQRLEEDKAKQAESLQSKASNFQDAMAAFKSQNPGAVSTPMPQQTRVLPKGGAQQQPQQRRTSDPQNLAAQNSPEKLMKSMGASKEQFEELMNVQQNADSVMKGPEYQKLLKANQEANGKNAEITARLMEIQEGLQANQDAVTSKFSPPTAQPQQMSLMASPAQQSTSSPRMAASVKTVLEEPVEPSAPTEPPKPGPHPRETTAPQNQRGGQWDIVQEEWEEASNAYNAWEDANAAYEIEYSQYTKDLEAYNNQTSDSSSDSSSSEKRVVEEPTKPEKTKYAKPSTPRDCSDKQGTSRESCMVARKREQDAMADWQAVENSWSQYDSDLEEFQNFDPNDNTGSDTGDTGNTNNNNNNNNTGGDVNKDGQTEGNVGSSDYTRIEKSDSGAPTVIDQQRPGVTAPTMEAEQITKERPVMADYKDSVDAEGNVTKTAREKFDAALRFYDNEATGRGTITTANQVESVGTAKTLTGPGDVSASGMVSVAEQQKKPVQSQFVDKLDADGNVVKTKAELYTQALNNWKERTTADAPEDITAKGFEATEAAATTATAAADGTVTQTATADAPTLTERADAADIDATAVEAAKATEIDRQAQTVAAVAATAYDVVKESGPYNQLVARKEFLIEKRNKDPKYAELNQAVADAEASGDKEAINAATRERWQYNEGIRELESERLNMLDAAGVEKVAEVEGPEAAARVAQTIGADELDSLMALAEERGVDVEDMEEYKVARWRVAQTGTAAEGAAAQITGQTPEATAATAQSIDADFTPQGGNTEIDGTPAFEKAATRTAQVGEAAERVASELGDAPALDIEGREAITGTAPQGNASQIGGVPTVEASRMNAVTGADRNAAAADMMEVVAGVPAEVTAAIAEDPATVEAQIDSGADPKVTAAVAALPTEALVSTQMENLLAGMEEGKTPAWARPALAAIEANLAKRGMSASSIGRDAMFNAIIQSALPIAQSNATALQARAQQNLSNEQQANLASAQNTMTVRMQNLANRQTAASQTAAMAQEIKVQQGSFSQQATMTEAQQEQQTLMADAQMAQERAKQESAQKQQAAIATLDSNTQKDLQNLRALNAAESQNMTAEQQTRLARYEATVNKVMRQADLKQDMEKANLGASLQIEMANLTEQNAASKDTMTAEQTERLTAFNALVDFRKTDASMAQQMDMANMSNEQQMELAMLSDRAATDTANFTAENQFRLSELQAKVARSVRQGELNARMEEVNLDASLKIELSELSERNATSRANMTSEQQTRLANLNTLVDFKKTNVAMAQQMEMANLSNDQQMEMAELADRSATDAANFSEANRFRLQELSQATSILSQNEELRSRADMAKLSSSERVALANLTAKNQADAQSMTAENTAELQRYEKQMGAAQVNAQLAQQMGITELSNAQQTAMFNAQVNSNLDIKKFDADQQTQLANSKFMQTMEINQFSAEQQAAMQNATTLASMDLATADQATKLAITNAQNFLQMDMANLSNEQQASVMNAQMSQQRLISNAAAQNAAAQFGAASENDTAKFMEQLSAQVDQYNTTAAAAREQFNATEKNRQAAIKAGNINDINKFNKQMKQDISKFNEQQDLARDQWNAANAQAVEQSNVQWRRQANTADTAAQNAANQQNAQMSFNLTSQELTQVWQQLRDEAAYVRQSFENEEQRNAQLLATAIGNEEATPDTASGRTWIDIFKNA
jgi:hypothetical protein